MAYEKHNWVNGEVIDADKLNHIEDGIAETVQLTEQTLTDEQKLNARININAANYDDVWEAINMSVSYLLQSDKSEFYKKQARTNIGAITAAEAPVQSVNGQTGAVVISGSGNSNLEVGSTSGSIRGINSPSEDISYTMGKNAVAFGTSTARGEGSFATGSGANASGYGSHAEGGGTQAQEQYSHAEGSSTTASGKYSHAEGGGTQAKSDAAHAEGVSTTATGNASHAEGVSTKTNGTAAHAEGNGTEANQTAAHAEGDSTKANGASSHAEGNSTIANTTSSHAEGSNTRALGIASHAEGGGTTASAAYAHAEGSGTNAYQNYSHAEGYGTVASGISSHTEGENTIALGRAQHVFGINNIQDSATNDNFGTYVEIVGNGTSSTRSNARTLDWTGNEVLSGKLTVGAQATADNDVPTLAQVRALIQEYLNNNNN